MLLLEAWHAIRVLCFNSWSQSANWAMDMFRERKYPEAHETCRACLFDTRSFFASFFPSTSSCRITAWWEVTPSPPGNGVLGRKAVDGP